MDYFQRPFPLDVAAAYIAHVKDEAVGVVQACPLELHLVSADLVAAAHPDETLDGAKVVGDHVGKTAFDSAELKEKRKIMLVVLESFLKQLHSWQFSFVLNKLKSLHSHLCNELVRVTHKRATKLYGYSGNQIEYDAF